ncbi:hypothetical protein HGA64_00335 [Candidatus Falkowbacteria bacterium]|nr:hypothetical protein [Candidatus Falkowbacteria bacterium]
MLSQSQQFFEQIRKKERILISFNKHWSVDAASSALALKFFLEKIGKTADIIVSPKDNILAFDFLPDFSSISTEPLSGRDLVISLSLSNGQAGMVRHKMHHDRLDIFVSPLNGELRPEQVTSRIGEFAYDLIIIVDSRDLDSLGEIYEKNTELFYQVPVINIDNHPANEGFGQINLVELTATSSTEIIFNLLSDATREAIDENIATCLLAGIISKTRSFRTHNITPTTLNAVAQLIALGGRREEIVNQLYRSRQLNVLKLWGVVLARLKSTLDSQLVWSMITAEDFRKTGTTPLDLAEVVDELIVSISKIKAIALLYETEGLDKPNVVDLYSVKNFNASSLLSEFEPIGNHHFAQARLDADLGKIEESVIASLTAKIAKLSQ